MANILGKLADFVSGGLFKEVKEGVMSYFPPDLSPQQKAEIENNMTQFLHKKELEAQRILNEAGKQLDQRIAEQEGTAKDLKSLPVVGRLLLFLRGAQRPVWGFATLFMDWQWFFGSGSYNEQQQTALIVINALVLGFLFGERAIKNLEPLITKVFTK